jgi:hypothetical protein
MKPDAISHARPVPADDIVRPQDQHTLGELFALLGNDRLKQALAELEPTTRPSTEA